MSKLIVIPTIIFSISIANPVFAQNSGGGKANSMGASEMINAGLNGAVGAQNAAKCGPKNPYACVVAVMSFAQLFMSLMQSGGSFDARDVLAPNVDWGLDPGIVNPGDNPIPTGLDTGWIDPINPALESGKRSDYENAKIQLENKAKGYLDQLAKQGYSFDPNTGQVRGPNGVVDTSKFNMANADIDKYMNGLKDRLGELDTSGGGGLIVGSGGAGGGAGFGRGLAGEDGDYGSSRGSNVDNFLNNLKKGDVDGSKLSGMSKSAGDGDRIGVAMNNIFKMIQIKYNNIDKSKQFLDK